MEKDNLTENEQIQEKDRKDFITHTKEAIGLEPLYVKFKKLDNRAIMPTYAHDGDVGMDLTAISVEYEPERDMYIYHTGLAFETNEHYGMLLFPRSSNRNTEAYLCNHVGIADTAIYRGEIILCYKNRTSLANKASIERFNAFIREVEHVPFVTSNADGIVYTMPQAIKNSENAYWWVYNNPMDYAPYRVGDRIGQMVIIPYPDIQLKEVYNLSETVRNENGFGSSGN